jgi:copper transport protein
LDWLHIMAMVAWLGGLVPLVIAIAIVRRTSERVLSLRPLIPRFSRLAMICVAILILTGVYSYLQQINNLDLLAATTYGRAFAAKLGLFGLLLVLAAVNLFYLSPRLRATGNHLARAFGRSVRLEIAAGALALLAVGVMTSVAPAKTAWEEHERQGLAQSASVENVDLVLRVAPAQIGDNEFAVDVTDKRPDAAGRPSKLLLRFDMLGMEMQPLQIETQTADTQRYTARGSYTSMGGRWNIEVLFRRAGFQDVRHTFEMDIVRPAPVALQ